MSLKVNKSVAFVLTFTLFACGNPVVLERNASNNVGNPGGWSPGPEYPGVPGVTGPTGEVPNPNPDPDPVPEPNPTPTETPNPVPVPTETVPPAPPAPTPSPSAPPPAPAPDPSPIPPPVVPPAPHPTPTSTETPGTDPDPDPTPTVTPTTPPVTYGQCYLKSYQQPHAQQVNKISLGFVVDTSGSMDDERKALAQSVGNFVEQLPSNIEVRVGVFPAHGATSKWAGRLWAGQPSCNAKKGTCKEHGHGDHQIGHSDALVLDSTKMSRAQLERELVRRLSKMPVDPKSDGGESMMHSFTRSLEDRLVENQDAGFYASDRAVAMFFMSDENDICFPAELNGYAKKFPDYAADGEKEGSISAEAAAYKRDCFKSGKLVVTPQSVVDKLRAHQAGLPYVMGGVVYSDPKTIKVQGENSLGHGILQMVEIAGGMIVDLAKRDFRGAMAKFGDLTRRAVTLLTEFNLRSDHDVAGESIQVRVDGKTVLNKWHPETHTVEIKPADTGQPGSKVEIRYCLKPYGEGSELPPFPQP